MYIFIYYWVVHEAKTKQIGRLPFRLPLSNLRDLTSCCETTLFSSSSASNVMFKIFRYSHVFFQTGFIPIPVGLQQTNILLPVETSQEWKLPDQLAATARRTFLWHTHTHTHYMHSHMCLHNEERLVPWSFPVSITRSSAFCSHPASWTDMQPTMLMAFQSTIGLLVRTTTCMLTPDWTAVFRYWWRA